MRDRQQYLRALAHGLARVHCLLEMGVPDALEQFEDRFFVPFFINAGSRDLDTPQNRQPMLDQFEWRLQHSLTDILTIPVALPDLAALLDPAVDAQVYRPGDPERSAHPVLTAV